MGSFKVIAGGRGSKARDDREFTQLYLESYGLVYNYVRRRMGGDAAAEDVVSEAYLLAARSFDRFDPSRAKFSTWVLRIAINCMSSYYRSERASVPLDELPEAVVSEWEEYEYSDDAERLRKLLALLDERELKIVLMKYRDGMRNVDIAAKMDMNSSTVSTILSRAMAKMRAAAGNE